VRAYRHGRPFTRAELNDAVINVLLTERLHSGCRVYAYCLMPDHLHVVAAPSANACSVLAYVDRFKALSTRAIWQLGMDGRLWQPRSYDHVLRCEEHLDRVCEYVLTNPVRGGLVADPDSYRWSGGGDPLPPA
jgi:putative transposase